MNTWKSFDYKSKKIWYNTTEWESTQNAYYKTGKWLILLSFLFLEKIIVSLLPICFKTIFFSI